MNFLFFLCCLGCVEALENRTSGVLALLDEECKVPKGTEDVRRHFCTHSTQLPCRITLSKCSYFCFVGSYGKTEKSVFKLQ
jgi:hypothetical protein